MSGVVVMLSGGMDSAVCLFAAASEYGPGPVKPVFFDWGQRALDPERRAAEALSAAAGTSAPIEVRVRFPYDGLLTVHDAVLPSGRSPGRIAGDGGVATFFPGRNIVFLSYAFGVAAEFGCGAVYFGACADDEAGYPDCRMDFLASFLDAARIGLQAPHVRLELPLIGLGKSEVVELGNRLGVPWELTFSCYAPAEDAACGECDSCVLRDDAFRRSDR